MLWRGPSGLNSDDTEAERQGSNSLFLLRVSTRRMNMNEALGDAPINPHQTSSIDKVPSARQGIKGVSVLACIGPERYVALGWE